MLASETQRPPSKQLFYKVTTYTLEEGQVQSQKAA